MPIQSGTHLGPYEILSAIGAGGMGETGTPDIYTLRGILSASFSREERSVPCHTPRYR
jgi:hypothetical protein